MRRSAIDTPMQWHRAGRSCVIGENVVAASQPLAASAGLEMLRRGGTAADAAVAAAAVLTVVEPTGCGLGSDAFAIVHDGNAARVLESSGSLPSAHEAKSVETFGWNSVTVPGAVAAWVELHRAHGKLEFAELLAPAIDYARDGFGVSPKIAEAWGRSVKVFGNFDEWRRVFAPDGAGPGVGQRVRLPDHAMSLESIAATNGESFYRGELAQRVHDEATRLAAPLRAEDLANHRAAWTEPLRASYQGFELLEPPPPGQGIAALIALRLLSHFTLDSADHADSLHVQIESMKLALADAYRHVADPRHMTRDVRWLLDDVRLNELASTIDPRHAADPGPDALQSGGTVYLAAADASGLMVSFIQSNFLGFGSGIVVPGTGIALQNRGYGFSSEPGHVNAIAPNKRPFHTIMPGFLIDPSGKPFAALGIMGGAMQAQAHVQATIRLTQFGQDPQQTLDAPRWRVMGSRRVIVEEGFDDDVLDVLRARGHEITIAPPHEFGGGQIIRRDDANGVYIAGSDGRKDGGAVAF